MDADKAEQQRLRQERKKAAKEAKKAKALAKKKQQSQQPKKSNAGGGKKKKELRLKTQFINTTKPGDKKPISETIEGSYDPPAVEAAWYDWWEKQGYFKPTEGGSDESFVMVIPPPNVTGSLHLGHALTNSVQDTLVRWHRMEGHTTLWVPGLDHAGIATQVVVEKKLMRETKQTRHDIGREKFVEEVWKWKSQYGDRILDQLKRLGSSLDWERLVFTMDDKLSKAVNEAFVRLHQKGLIYRKTRLVNWDCLLKTAVSDIEVEYLELTGRKKHVVPGHDGRSYELGVIISFAYEVCDSDEKLIVATTRLETMLGDSGVAVHPEDERYKHLHGKFLQHPFCDRKIPIITDPVLVDMSFGTGAVKITPAHDPNDYECGIRNNLEFINVLNDDGTMNENAGEFKGMRRMDARVAVLKKMKELGLYIETKDNPMSIGICSRSKDLIEPRLKPQWYVDLKDMAALGVKAVKEGELEILPESQHKTWFHWLENIRDWCISRQLWWGHRIPAYTIHIEGKGDPDANDASNWVVAGDKEAALKIAIERNPDVDPSKITLQQDPDVLDTWFSSALFPFSVFGWPDKTPDLAKFYPTSTIETGHDIIFFWIARMVMMGQELTGVLPFKRVLFHTMVRDSHGKKMSKSVGNVLDPIDVIEGITLEQLQKRLESSNLDPKELKRANAAQKKDFPAGISECGTDAMRLALCSYMAQGRDINLDINRVVSYRNFCNKMWNACKFAISKAGKYFKYEPMESLTLKTPEKWILNALNVVLEQTLAGLKDFELGNATQAIYKFWLNQLCDVYLESTKGIFTGDDEDAKTASGAVLYLCVEQGLRVLHPFMPFVTEELWQHLPKNPDTEEKASIMICPFPHSNSAYSYPEADADLEYALSLIRAIRSLKETYKLRSVPAYIVTENAALVDNLSSLIKSLAGISELTVCTTEEKPPNGCAVKVEGTSEIHVLVKGHIDLEKEIARVEKAKAKLQSAVANVEKKISDKAPESVKKAQQAQIEKYNAEIEALDNAMATLRQMV